jgi:DNA-3-methyladenine glycosylase II
MTAGLPQICEVLAAADPALARAIDAVSLPVVRRRPHGFEGLFRIVVAQQLSVAAAGSIAERCAARLERLEPERVAAADDTTLRECGLSAAKIRCVKAMAEAVLSGGLDFGRVARLDDDDARAALLDLKGVGPWTAAIYLLFAESRMDIWPPKDVALLAAYTAAAGLDERPAMAAFDESAARFAPYRGYAAHLLWTYYGHLKQRPPV